MFTSLLSKLIGVPKGSPVLTVKPSPVGGLVEPAPKGRPLTAEDAREERLQRAFERSLHSNSFGALPSRPTSPIVVKPTLPAYPAMNPKKALEMFAHFVAQRDNFGLDMSPNEVRAHGELRFGWSKAESSDGGGGNEFEAEIAGMIRGLTGAVEFDVDMDAPSYSAATLVTHHRVKVSWSTRDARVIGKIQSLFDDKEEDQRRAAKTKADHAAEIEAQRAVQEEAQRVERERHAKYAEEAIF